MNETLSNVLHQLAAIWRQITISQKVTILMATTVIVGGLIAFVFWASRTDYDLLYGRLDDAEAAKVVAALDEAKVPYQIGRGGGAIYVPADKVHLMRMQLAVKGIPRGEGVGYEIYDKSNFGISDFVQRANHLRALQGELSRSISQFDEIDGARVMIVLPETRLLVDAQRRPTASVLVRVKGNRELSTSTVNSIRLLVANSVEGLQTKDVSVVDNRGTVLSEAGDSTSLGGLTGNQLSVRRNLEQYLSKKAEGMLEQVLGPGRAVVRVSAEIDFETVTRTEEKFDPDMEVVRTSKIEDESTDSARPEAFGGVAGVISNLEEQTNVLANATLGNTRHKKKTVNNTYELNRTTSYSTTMPGGVKRLTAAVFIAAKMNNGVMAPRSTQELERLTRTVRNALGLQEKGEDRADEIALEEITFNEQPAFEFAQTLDRQETRQFWGEAVRNLVYPLLGVLVLLIFWRIYQRAPSETIPIGVPVGTGQEALETRTRGPEPSPVSVDLLNQLIRENPANMSQAIRGWLARGDSANKN